MMMNFNSNGSFSSLNSVMEVESLGFKTYMVCVNHQSKNGIWIIYSRLLVIDTVSYHFCTIYAGRLCIEVTPASKIAFISEELCIGCGICVKVSKLLIFF